MTITLPINPLPLNPLIFLYRGAREDRLALAEALAEQDRAMGIRDFETPYRHALLALKCETPYIEFNLDNPETRREPFLNTTKTNEELLRDLKLLLSKNFGLTPGDLAAYHLKVEDDLNIFDRIIFRDLETIDDLKPFLETFGSDHIVVIMIDSGSSGTTSLSYTIQIDDYPVRIISLQSNTAELQMKELSKILRPLATTR